MLNRPPVKGLEFSLATVVAAVVPAAIRAAFFGSFFSAFAAALFGIVDATRYWEWTAEFAGEMLLVSLSAFIATLFVGALIGIAFCGFYLVAICVPIAWLLRERLGTSKGLVAILISAPLAAYIASGLLGAGPMNWATSEGGWAFGLACAFTVPAAIYFRRDIMIARAIGPQAEA